MMLKSEPVYEGPESHALHQSLHMYSKRNYICITGAQCEINNNLNAIVLKTGNKWYINHKFNS